MPKAKLNSRAAFSKKHLIVFVFIFGLIGSLYIYRSFADSLVITDRTWQCDGTVNYDLVQVRVNTGSNRQDGVHLNCSGRIGRLEIDNWSGDGIKIHQEARNLVVESGYVRLHDCPNSIVHMDGIQAMGGNNVRFNNFEVDATELGPQGCGANSALFINEGAGGNGKPTDVVFENSVFKKLTTNNRTVRIGSSVNSGIRNSTVYWCGESANCGAGQAIWFGDPSQQVNPINENNTIRLYSDSPSPPPPPPNPPPPPAQKPGDLNGDGSINITDLSILLSYFNTNNELADINKDGTVNIMDLSILLSNYGR